MERNLITLNTLAKKESELPKRYKTKRQYLWATVGVWAVVMFFVWPVFRSGNRTALTGFEWLVNHTRWGPPVEFVPEEDYLDELSPPW